MFLEAVEDAPTLVKAAGYLSPTAGNSYTYRPIDFTDPTYAAVYATVMYKQPFISLREDEDPNEDDGDGDKDQTNGKGDH